MCSLSTVRKYLTLTPNFCPAYLSRVSCSSTLPAPLPPVFPTLFSVQVEVSDTLNNSLPRTRARYFDFVNNLLRIDYNYPNDVTEIWDFKNVSFVYKMKRQQSKKNNCFVTFYVEFSLLSKP